MSDGAKPMPSAGMLLRQARSGRGLHIAALAAQLKVPPRRLEALEGDRYDELPDSTFTRALAQSMCRQLKIDPEPVLSRLPPSFAQRLEHATHGIDAPFRDRPGRAADPESSWLAQPIVWGPGLILVAALLLYALPASWIERLAPGAPAAPAAEVAPAPVATPVPAAAPLPATLSAATAAAPVAIANPAPAAPPAGETVHPGPGPQPATGVAADPPLLVRANGQTWVRVIDAGGRTLLSRTVKPGETLALDGAPPLKVRIGNAGATELRYRGEPVDLRGVTRDNIAQLELK